MTEEEFNDYFLNNYNTKLTPEQEAAFQQWVAEQSERKGRDISQDQLDYDIRGAFLDLVSGKMKEDERGHTGDTYKKPNHPTFSDQSVYHNTDDPFTGGKFIGGTWGENTYTPSIEMLNSTHPMGFLVDYMQKREPDIQLIFPDGALEKGRKNKE